MAFDPGRGKILQEVLKDDPWRMLVGCILLNLTTRAQVDGVREELFRRWPTALRMSVADKDELASVLRPLGLQNKRSQTLIQFSTMWCEVEVTNSYWPPGVADVAKLHGVGKYALDSYKIFVLGWELSPGDVEDRVLKKYLELKLDPQV